MRFLDSLIKLRNIKVDAISCDPECSETCIHHNVTLHYSDGRRKSLGAMSAKKLVRLYSKYQLNVPTHFDTNPEE